jgi:glycosyltransferase involved in cell wall biosynthesis
MCEQQHLEEGNSPLVTVVIPCYNQAHFLREAIESVHSQTYRNFEIIVIDDGSTDNTSEVASRYEQVRLLRQENRGLAGARNTGIRHSEGDYLVFLDADDRLLPEALEVGVRELETHPGCAFVSGHCSLISADGSFLSTPPGSQIEGGHYLTLLRYNYVWTPGVAMFRRAVLESVGAFDTSLKAAEDWDIYLRVASKLPIFHHGEVVVEYRQHGSKMTGDPALMLSHCVAVVRSQREHVKGSKQRTKAYRTGLRAAKEYYGEPLAEEVRAHIQQRRWGRALRGVLTLLRYYPRGVMLLDQRRMQRQRVTRQLQAVERELQSHKQELREHRRQLRTLGDGRIKGQSRYLEELTAAVEKEQKAVQRLKGRFRRLRKRLEEL